MALKPLNSVAGFSVGETPANIILANGDITTNNITTTGVANLNAIGNIRVSGGSNGQVIQTDGAGNLSFVSISSSALTNGNSNIQVLANANLTFSSAGNANVVVISGGGANVVGYLTVDGNINANGNVSVNNYLVTPVSTDLIVAPGSVLTRFYSDVNPYSDGGYDLGNGLARWNNVFSYYSNIEGNLDVSGTATVSGIVDFTSASNVSLGPVGNLHISGGSDGYVLQTDGAGNLSWQATGSPSIIHNGDSNVSVPSANGNVYINANASVDQQWVFDTNGFLTLAGTGVITAPLGSSIDIFTGNGASYSEIYLVDNGNVYIATQGETYNWIFDTTGNTTLPAAGTANLGNLAIANFANFMNDLVVQGNIANANNITVTNNITSDTANVTGNLTSGNANLGNLAIANNFATNGTGGDITLTGGNIQGANVVLANSFTSNGGLVDFATNNPNVQLGNVDNVHIGGGSAGYVLATDGSGVLTWVATGTQSEIYNGASNVSIPVADGNVYINANSGTDQQWNFATSGNLVLPLGGIISESSSPTGVGNTITLTPSGGSNVNQQLLIYPTITEGDHLHLTTGNLAVTSLFLGNDIQYIRTNTDGSMVIGTDDSQPDIPGYGYRWVFDVNGNLTAPSTGTANLGNLVTANYGNFNNDLVVQGNIANANNISVTNNITAGSANITTNLDVGGNITTGSGGIISGVNYLFANVANISNTVLTGQIANGTSNIRLDLNGNITISSNNSSNVFTFSDLGANVIGYIQANGIISAGGFLGSNLVSNVGILSLLAQQTGGDYNINLQTGGAGNVDVGGTYITSLHDPVNPQDAATKAYVDLVAQGLHVHAPANLATATDLATVLAIPSGNVVYNQPGPEGVGATLTFSGNSLTLLDSVPVTSGMRLLIKNEANAVWNGVYSIGSNALFITRSTDEDNNADLAGGDFLFVQSGTQFADTGWVQTTDNVVIGTSNIVFTQFSGAGSYTGANGILVSGTVITANVDNDTTAIVGGNITVKVGANLVTPNIGAATGTSLDLTGNVLAGNLNSNATITAVDASFTGNLEVGGNITTTGATGNISGANVIFANSFVSNGGLVDFNTNSANVQLGSNANVHLYGGSNGQVLQTDGAGNLNWYSISANSISNGNSNVSIPTANGNVYINASGADQWVFDTSGVLTAPGQVNVGGNLYMANDSAVSFPYGSYLQENSVSHGLTIQGGTSLTLQTSSGTGNIVLTTDGGSANFDNTGNFTLPAIATANLGNLVVANTVNTNTVNVGPLSQITYGNVTTVGISANQTIASLNATGITGAEFLVKAIDSGGKYSVATVLAVTDGTDVDYTIYGTTQLGGYTGSLAVNVVGGYLRLQVTPASSNSTVWVTQARTI